MHKYLRIIYSSWLDFEQNLFKCWVVKYLIVLNLEIVNCKFNNQAGKDGDSTNLFVMFKRKAGTRKESIRHPNAKEVKVSIIFTRLGEIDTINERLSCEATLFITWSENLNMLKKCDQENSEDNSYYWDPKTFWDPQLYIDSKQPLIANSI